MKIGYSRVSTSGENLVRLQNMEAQLSTRKRFGG